MPSTCADTLMLVMPYIHKAIHKFFQSESALIIPLAENNVKRQTGWPTNDDHCRKNHSWNHIETKTMYKLNVPRAQDVKIRTYVSALMHLRRNINSCIKQTSLELHTTVSSAQLFSEANRQELWRSWLETDQFGLGMCPRTSSRQLCWPD